MKYDELDLYCFHYHNQQKYSNIKGLSEEDKKCIIETKELKKEVKRENYHELQCFIIPEMLYWNVME